MWKWLSGEGQEKLKKAKKGHVSLVKHVLELSHEKTCMFKFWKGWKRGETGLKRT